MSGTRSSAYLEYTPQPTAPSVPPAGQEVPADEVRTAGPTVAMAGWRAALRRGSRRLAALLRRTVGWPSLLLLAAGALGFAREWRRRPITLEPLRVPAQLQARGYPGEILTDVFLDRVTYVRRIATTRGPMRSVVGAAEAEASDDAPKIKIGATGLSLDAVLQYVLALFGHEPVTLTAAVVLRPDSPYVLVRTSSGASARVPLDTARVAATVEAAADSAVHLTNPYQLAAFLYARNDTARARREAEYILAHSPAREHASAHYLLGVLILRGADHADSGRRRAASYEFERAAQLEPAYGAPYLGHAWLLDTRDPRARDSALALYAHAMRDDRTRAFAAARRSELLLRGGQVEEAVALAREAVAHDPGDARARAALAEALCKRADASAARAPRSETLRAYREAAESYREAWIRDSTDPMQLVRYAYALRKAGDRSAAMRLYAQAEGVQPPDVEVLTHVAATYAAFADGSAEERALAAAMRAARGGRPEGRAGDDTARARILVGLGMHAVGEGRAIPRGGTARQACMNARSRSRQQGSGAIARMHGWPELSTRHAHARPAPRWIDPESSGQHRSSVPASHQVRPREDEEGRPRLVRDPGERPLFRQPEDVAIVARYRCRRDLAWRHRAA